MVNAISHITNLPVQEVCNLPNWYFFPQLNLLLLPVLKVNKEFLESNSIPLLILKPLFDSLKEESVGLTS